MPAGVPVGAYWVVDSWFPHGTFLLADVWEPGSHISAWTVSMLGQSPRMLRVDAHGWEISRDGTQIAFSPATGSDSFTEIWVMSSQGDSPQKVLALGENERITNVLWSPDGQRLAYIRGRAEGTAIKDSSIETCDLKGADRRAVVPFSYPTGVVWLPDGRMVISSWKGPSKTINLWQIAVDSRAGASVGQPKRIAEWVDSGIEGLSASGDGKRLALIKSAEQRQVYLGELVAGGTRMNLPRRLANDEADDLPSAWTADSKAVLFDSRRNGQHSLFKQATGQDTAESIATPPQGKALWPRVSADGAWILYKESPRPNDPPYRLMRIPVGGGVPQFVMEVGLSPMWSCARAPATQCVVKEDSPDAKQLVITAFDPLKGRGKVLRTIKKDPQDGFTSTLSPDASTLAISRTGGAEIHIRLLSLAGGADREITVKGRYGLPFGGLDWSADGKGFYCGSASDQGFALLYVDLSGSARVLWEQRGWSEIMGKPSPDGRYLAIGGRLNPANVWMLEGF